MSNPALINGENKTGEFVKKLQHKTVKCNFLHKRKMKKIITCLPKIIIVLLLTHSQLGIHMSNHIVCYYKMN